MKNLIVLFTIISCFNNRKENHKSSFEIQKKEINGGTYYIVSSYDKRINILNIAKDGKLERLVEEIFELRELESKLKLKEKELEKVLLKK